MIDESNHIFADDMGCAHAHGTVEFRLALGDNRKIDEEEGKSQEVCFAGVLHKHGSYLKPEGCDEKLPINLLRYYLLMRCHRDSVEPYYTAMMSTPLISYLLEEGYISYDWDNAELDMVGDIPSCYAGIVLPLFRLPCEFGALADAVVVLMELYGVEFTEAFWLVNNWDTDRYPDHCLQIGEPPYQWNSNHLVGHGSTLKGFNEGLNVSEEDIDRISEHYPTFERGKVPSPMGYEVGVVEWATTHDSIRNATGEGFNIPLDRICPEAYNELHNYLETIRGIEE